MESITSLARGSRFDSARRAEHAERVLARTRHQIYNVRIVNLNICFVWWGAGAPYQTQLIAHLETRQLPCSSTINKFFIGMMVDIPNYIGKREVTMSLTSFAVWILQFAVLMAGVMLLEVIDEPFMPRAMQKIMSWL